MTGHVSPLRALLAGIGDVLRSPLLLVGVAVVTLLSVLPFAAMLESRLQASLSVQPHVSLDETEIDPEWWMEFREYAHGLEATFTPAVLGFAATLDGISSVLDGNAIPNGIIQPLVVSMLIWAFLWGAVLTRFNRSGSFFRGGLYHFAPFVIIAILAAIANLILFLTVHRVLFGPVHAFLVGLTSTERDAFLIRVVLYFVFFSLIALVSLIADYARVAAVVHRTSSIGSMVRGSTAFVRARFGAVVGLFILTGAIFVAATAAYGALEVVGGSEVGGWRAVAIGQAYVFVRLAIRLTFAASELRLFSTNHAAAAE